MKSLLLSVLVFSCMIYSCRVPESIEGEYITKLDDSLDQLFRFSADSQYYSAGIYEGKKIFPDSGHYFIRNDSIFFCEPQPDSTACDGLKLSSRLKGTLVIHYHTYVVYDEGQGSRVFKEKQVLRRTSPH